jgi:predicted esterase
MRTCTLCLAMILALSGRGSAAGTPAGLLKAEGRSAEWVKATAKCRELLGKIKLDDAKVKPYRAKIEADCAMLSKHKGGFGWRQITGVQFLENMLADLADGKTPNLRYRGKGVAVAYWSNLMQRMEAIWIHVPPSYDPAKTYQLFMCYKSGGGIHFRKGKAHGGYRPTAEVANKFDTFFAWSSLYYGVKGRKCAVDEAEEAIPAICRAFTVDPDRIFNTGYSDGGFTDLWLGGYYPHLFAGIAPGVANWQYSNINQIGLLNVPVLVVDGWGDGGYNRENFVRFHNLDTMGGDVAATWSQQGHAYTHFERLAIIGKTLEWAKTKRRNLWPKRVRYATWNVTWNRAYWFSIQRFSDSCLPAQIDAEVKDGNRIEVKAWNVAAYKLALSDKLVDMAKPVTVVTNGKESYSGPAKAELLIELEPKPKGKYVKDADMPGGIGCQTVRSWYGAKRERGGFRIPSRGWLRVRPTGGDAATKALIKNWAGKWTKDDSAVSAKDIASKSLLLFGGPDVNKITAKIAAELPIKFGKGWFSVGDKKYDQPGNAIKFIHPNPLNPKKYVIVYAFNDAAAAARLKFRNLTGESAWTFRKADCQVFNVRRAPRKWGVALGGRSVRTDHHFFDASWKPAAREKLGTLTAPLGYAQILKLRAEAVREATGADVGLVWGYVPGYLRWSNRLEAGPVTMADLAAVEALPEYVELCEIKGSRLYGTNSRGQKGGYLTSVPASTMAIKDVDPNKTYTVASNYYGLPHYGANTKAIPDSFHFESVEEFLANKNTNVPYRKLRQIPLTVNEAVAAYIKKRGTVKPPAVVGTITHYLMNPEVNEFPKYDWLHVGVDTTWRRAGQTTPTPARYTLALGLGAVGDKAEGAAKKGKLFHEFAAGQSASFATLGRRLPVTVKMAETTADIAVEGDAFKKVAAGTEGSAVQCRVLELTVTNTGKTGVAGLLALCPMTMDRRNGRTWPKFRSGRATTSRLAGFNWTSGPRKKPPTHQRAVVFDLGKPGPALTVRVMGGVGYNAGLVGITRSIAVKAGGKTVIRLLLANANKPKDVKGIDLAKALAALHAAE